MASTGEQTTQPVTSAGACPICSGRRVKSGIYTWHSRGKPNELQRWQRLKCVICGHFSYSYIDTVILTVRESKQQHVTPNCGASTNAVGEGGSVKVKGRKHA